MKTINNVQKTVLKSLAVTAGSLIISLTVSAQDLWQSFNNNEPANEIALAIIDNSNKSMPALDYNKEVSDVNLLETLFKTESENAMVLEEWMTNEDLFKAEEDQTKKKIIKTATFVFEEISDSKLEFEDWMFNPRFWSVRK